MVYQDKEKYKEAHKWANKALKIDSLNPDALFNFAELLKNTVESCQGENLDLSDKAVFEISFKYYMKAGKRGHKDAKNMVNWFKDNKKIILPTLEDWFLVSVEGEKLKPIEIDSQKLCYSWIEQKVERIQ